MTEEKKSKEGMSRRQFLGYTLGGVGGFLGAGMIVPMVRFAIDPALRTEGEGNMVKIGPIDKFTAEPTEVKFKVKQVDGWVTSQAELIAWITKSGNDILALSPICKHLGCTVNWAANKDYPKQYFCPCHFGRYEINGKNVPGTPPLKPLDEYETQVKDGILYLGQIKPNRLAT